MEVYPRESYYLASKTMAKTPEDFRKTAGDVAVSSEKRTIWIYTSSTVPILYYRPGDGTGMYECMEEAKRQGKIRHIGITAHKLQVALDAVASGLYETLQFPFSYLSSAKEIDLVRKCAAAGMGFIAMKGLAGGLINQSKPAMAFMTQFGQRHADLGNSEGERAGRVAVPL